MALPPTGAATAPLVPSGAANSAAANTYSDLNALAALKRNPQSPQALHAVSQQVDALFLQMMLKSMREASADAGEPQSNEMDMYQDMFDKQVALSLSQHGGLGLGAALTRSAGAASGQTPPPPPAPAAAVAAGTDAPATPDEFVNRVLPAIREAATTLGVSPLGLLAQAALETGWGQRMPRTADGTSSLNLFGVKANDGWEGARAPATTLEYRDGVATPKRTAFRAYGSLTESATDFANLLGSSPRFKSALGAGATPAAYVEHIANAGYATDPGYADKLHKMLNSKVFRQAVAANGISI